MDIAAERAGLAAKLACTMVGTQLVTPFFRAPCKTTDTANSSNPAPSSPSALLAGNEEKLRVPNQG